MALQTNSHQIYANLMNEIRVRINFLGSMIASRDTWPPRLFQEFAYLQLRMLCEQIALGCLIAHGDIKDKGTLREWHTPRIMREMEKLNPDFYPKGIRVRREGENFALDEYLVPQLKREELIKLWQISGNFLHRGSGKTLVNESPEGPEVDIDEILSWSNKILNLMEQHIISSSDKKSHLVVALSSEDHGRQSLITILASP
ncbi:hypothetical protein [Methylobacterium sp. Leaf125]|uniref:hypothetical protein n=1 Tax=Methylobacterium sp. Leaf125 TaxID=1736265 RepID=UPI000A598C08|nr:hypothetical protein [Methylobacterium sp. Leaf125]